MKVELYITEVFKCSEEQLCMIEKLPRQSVLDLWKQCRCRHEFWLIISYRFKQFIVNILLGETK